MNNKLKMRKLLIHLIIIWPLVFPTKSRAIVSKLVKRDPFILFPPEKISSINNLNISENSTKLPLKEYFYIFLEFQCD